MIRVEQKPVNEPAIPILALRPRDAATALGISERLLWTWTNRGVIPHTRIGKVIVYPVDCLRQWLIEQTTTKEGNDGIVDL